MSATAPANESPAAEPRPILEGALAPPADNHAARARKLGLGLLSIYGSGAITENITTFAIGQLLPFYLTIVCALSGTQAAIVVGPTLLVDSIFDPVIGSVSDNSRSRHGRRHPLMLAAILPIAVAFGLLFSVPRGLSGGMVFLYTLTALLATRFAVSVFQVPYFALGAELSDDYQERSTIVASRVIFTVGSGLLATALAWGVFLQGAKGRYEASAYVPMAWTFGAIAVATALISSLGTLGARGRLHTAAEGARFGFMQFLREAFEVLRNKSFRSLFFTCLILFAALGWSGALTVHAYTYFWKLGSGMMLVLGLLAPVGWIVGVFAAASLARITEKRWIAMLGLALIGVAQLGPVALRLAGLIGPPAYVPALAAGAILGGLGGCIATISFQSMMADAADEHEYLFGARREGLYFAGVTLSAKASSGLGAMIGLVALDVIGFPHGEAATPARMAAIPADIIRNLGITSGPAAAVFTAAAVVILLGYRITRQDHARILDEIRRRRATA